MYFRWDLKIKGNKMLLNTSCFQADYLALELHLYCFLDCPTTIIKASGRHNPSLMLLILKKGSVCPLLVDNPHCIITYSFIIPTSK